MAVLTVSRAYGSGGKEIGKKIAEDMGYRYIDRGQILADMKTVGDKWEELAKYYDENNPNMWERFKWSYRGYVALTQYNILSYALAGNAVIMGRGGSFLLKGIPYVLRIRTEAPLVNRIDRVMKWEDINSENAQWLIEKADKEMAGAVYLTYGFAWNDPEQYDLVFDTSIKSYEEIISIVVERLKQKDLLDTEESRKVLELRLLAAKIKAEIVINSKLHVSSFDVKLKEEGLVKYGLIVKGIAHMTEDISTIKTRVIEMSGGVPVEFDLKYRMHPRFGGVKFQ